MRHTGGVHRRRGLIRLLSFSFWTICGVVCGLQIWISMISHGHQPWRIVLYQVLSFNAWLLLSKAVGWMARRFPLIPPTRSAVLYHAIASLLIALVHSTWWAFLLVNMRPYDDMGPARFGRALIFIAFSGLPMQLLFYVGILAAVYAAEYYERYRERELETVRLAASLSEARLHALELQIQPHFLFNTLNSISTLVRTARNSEAVTMIAGLSDLLRYTLDHAGEQRVPLEEEADITRRYLEIQRTRFPDRMSFDIEVAPDALRAAVPTLILQPLAENAIRHGVARSAAAGRVEIRAYREAGMLHLDVFNTGTLGADHSMGIGLRNTIDRLRHLYGADHSFGLRQEENGVMASVAIPWSEVA